MINRSALSLVAVTAAALIGLAGCGSGAAPRRPARRRGAADAGGTAGTEATAGSAANGELELWAVQTGPLGVVVTDGTGQLIYRSDRDGNAPSASNCTGDCTATWEPVKADLNKPPVLLGVDEDVVGVLTRPDGTDQLTLAGWPLYRHLGTHTDEEHPGQRHRRRLVRHPPGRREGRADRPADRSMSRSSAAGPSRGDDDRGGRHGTHSRAAGEPGRRARPADLPAGRATFGAVPEPFAVVAHHPRLLRAGAARRGRVRVGRPGAADQPA